MEKEKLVCETCGKELSGRQQKYCCSKCKNNGSYKERNALPENRKRYQDIQNKKRILLKYHLIEAKGGKCEICEYNKNISALEFHHIDPNEKEFAISASTTTNLDKLLIEAEKCIILCANCHREIHHPELLLSEMKNYPNDKKSF